MDSLEDVDFWGSSPHTRGARAFPCPVLMWDGIIPAYAGSTSIAVPPIVSRRDHPRIRGEHTQLRDRLVDVGGSSPHTRGAPSQFVDEPSRARIIPAYAGSTVEPSEMLTAQKDHPRIRGEHISCSRFVPAIMGSSPHTRGALEMTLHKNGLVGIIPAYAGSTESDVSGAVEVEDHPRIRGEHRIILASPAGKLGSSPHTRGAHSGSPEGSRSFGIIPAYAGSTLRMYLVGDGDDGSSPHTRGARRMPGDPRRLRRIIPAYAGSTAPPRE